MQNLERDLFDFTGRELHELSWQANLPIHHGVALNSFFNAFKDYGQIGLTLNDRERKAKFDLRIKGKGQNELFITELSYDQILDGWHISRRASPKSLYDAIYLVYDRIGEQIEVADKSLFRSRKFDWINNFREVSPREIVKLMDSNLLEYFGKHHEGICLPIGKENSKIEEPKIFSRVLRKFPLDKLHNAIISQEVDHSEPLCGPRCGPCAKYILDMAEDEFEIGEYYPSEAALLDVFWGMYLQELAIQKEYPVVNGDYSLNKFINSRNDAFSRLYSD